MSVETLLRSLEDVVRFQRVTKDSMSRSVDARLGIEPATSVAWSGLRSSRARLRLSWVRMTRLRSAETFSWKAERSILVSSDEVEILVSRSLRLLRRPSMSWRHFWQGRD